MRFQTMLKRQGPYLPLPNVSALLILDFAIPISF